MSLAVPTARAVIGAPVNRARVVRRRRDLAGWVPPRARLLAHALCAALAADPAGAGPEAVVASRLLVALARLARRVDDAAARAPKAAERVVAALVDGVDTLDALCRAVVASSRALAKGDAHHAEPLVCEASAATLEVLARHAPLRVLACGAATQAFASLAERCAHPGLRAARRSLLDLLWFGVACAPSRRREYSRGRIDGAAVGPTSTPYVRHRTRTERTEQSRANTTFIRTAPRS